jgi:hypothetical protein
MAENYLQHAEHYNRIIAAAYAANPPQFQQGQNDGEEDNSMDGDNRFQSNPMPGSGGGDNNSQQPYDNNAPQPVIEGVPAEVALGEAAPAREQNDAEGQERRPSRNRRPRGPRPPREDGGQPSGGEDALSALPDFIARAPTLEPVSADE